MTRRLAPLLLVLVFGAIAVRTALHPSRAEARMRIAGMVRGGALEGATRRLQSYVGRFDGAGDRWFACRMWFRLGRPGEAIRTVWDDAGLAARPDTPRRFAENALYALGWEDEARHEATALEPHALLVLVQGGNAWAARRLREHARTLDLKATTSYFFPAYRSIDRRPMQILVDAYRTREDPRFLTAAALGRLGHGDDPRRDADRDRLVGVLADDTWRMKQPDVWYVSALALGRLADPVSLKALAQAAATLEGSSRPQDERDLAMVRVGQLASGNFGIEDKLDPYVFGPRPYVKAEVWTLEALLFRHARGDARAHPWLERMWTGPAARWTNLRTRMARALLLGGVPPDDDAQRAWYGRMERDLEAVDAPLVCHVVADAVRLKAHESGALERMIDLLRQAAANPRDLRELPTDVAPPVIEALRALYLYG